MFCYLALFTYNVRTGVVDRITSFVGMEASRWVLGPVDAASDRARRFWRNYVNFRDVRTENERLTSELSSAREELMLNREAVAEAKRLASLLEMNPPPDWKRQAARVIAGRVGPIAALETIMVDKGATAGLSVNTPVVTPGGVVGRVIRVSPTSSLVLLLTDSNSRVPVVGQDSRVQGILSGSGPDLDLAMLYVPIGSGLSEGELLVTSGLEEIFPKGVPIARISRIGQEDGLFMNITAAALTDPRRLEEVVVLTKEAPHPAPAQAEEPPADTKKPRVEQRPKKRTDRPEQPPAVAPAAEPKPGAARPAQQPQPAPQAQKPEPAPAPEKPVAEPKPAKPKRGQ